MRQPISSRLSILSSTVVKYLIFPAVLLSAATPGFAAYLERYATVERVIDGDTVRLRGGERVRYLGMDAPESGEPFYSQSRERNSGLVLHKKIRLLVCAGSARDMYGRTLAWIYSGDELVNLTLVKEGLARVLMKPPCGMEKESLFRRAEKQAVKEKKGLWAVKGADAKIDVPAYGVLPPGAASRKEISIRASEASRHIGEAAKVTGRVTQVHKSKKAVFIRFGSGNKAFTAVVFRDSLDDLASSGINPLAFKGKTIAVSGVIKEYKGAAEIIVKWPFQVDVNPR